MDNIVSCPNCHQLVKPTDYFCPNCGKKIRPAPLSTNLSSQIILYLKTLLLPPFGLIWGFQYLRQEDQRSKIIGLLVIIVTIVETIWLTQSTISIFSTLTQQISQQTQLYGL